MADGGHQQSPASGRGQPSRAHETDLLFPAGTNTSTLICAHLSGFFSTGYIIILKIMIFIQIKVIDKVEIGIILISLIY